MLQIFAMKINTIVNENRTENCNPALNNTLMCQQIFTQKILLAFSRCMVTTFSSTKMIFGGLVLFSCKNSII